MARVVDSGRSGRKVLKKRRRFIFRVCDRLAELRSENAWASPAGPVRVVFWRTTCLRASLYGLGSIGTVDSSFFLMRFPARTLKSKIGIGTRAQSFPPRRSS